METYTFPDLIFLAFALLGATPDMIGWPMIVSIRGPLLGIEVSYPENPIRSPRPAPKEARGEQDRDAARMRLFERLECLPGL